MSVPTDDAGWRELIRSGQPPCYRPLAEASGGRIWKKEGVFASIMPAAPERSIFNSVFYRHAPGIYTQLDAVAREYEEAGVKAWTVWVPEGQRGVAKQLERAGHVLDAEPRDMAMALDELRRRTRPPSSRSSSATTMGRWRESTRWPTATRRGTSM